MATIMATASMASMENTAMARSMAMVMAMVMEKTINNKK